MTALNPKQFRQGRLFAPLGMTKKPHQQTPLEFANSPRTMWHGAGYEHQRFSDLREEADRRYERDQSLNDGMSLGFHVGTLKAANERLDVSGKGGGFLHPLRIQDGGFWNSKEEAAALDEGPDYEGFGADMGVDWDMAAKPQYYKNRFEDKGSISAVLESPYQMDGVRHQSDFVREAVARGGIPNGQAEALGDLGLKREHFGAGTDVGPGEPDDRLARLPDKHPSFAARNRSHQGKLF